MKIFLAWLFVLGYYLSRSFNGSYAGVAELADAYGSGPYGGNPVKVQVLSPAPRTLRPLGAFFVIEERVRSKSGL